MKRGNLIATGVVILGATFLSIGYAATTGGNNDMDCEKMVRDHTGMMDKGQGATTEKGHMGMMGNDHGGMMGQGHMGMMGQDMPKDCMEMMEKHGKGMNMGDKSADKAAASRTHQGTGVVQSVDPSAGTVTLQHEAIQSIGWPAMTMAFSVQDKNALESVKPGQKVDFAFVQQGSRNVITSIK